MIGTLFGLGGFAFGFVAWLRAAHAEDRAIHAERKADIADSAARQAEKRIDLLCVDQTAFEIKLDELTDTVTANAKHADRRVDAAIASQALAVARLGGRLRQWCMRFGLPEPAGDVTRQAIEIHLNN